MNLKFLLQPNIYRSADLDSFKAKLAGHREVVDLIKKTGVSNKDFVFFKDEDEFMHIAAKTPRSNCVMDSRKLAAAGIEMTEVHTAVERDLKNWKKAK